MAADNDPSPHALFTAISPRKASFFRPMDFLLSPFFRIHVVEPDQQMVGPQGGLW